MKNQKVRYSIISREFNSPETKPKSVEAEEPVVEEPKIPEKTYQMYLAEEGYQSENGKFQ